MFETLLQLHTSSANKVSLQKHNKIAAKRLWLFGIVSTQLLLSACTTTAPAPVTTRPMQGGYQPNSYPISNPVNSGMATAPNISIGSYPTSNAGFSSFQSNPQIQVQPYQPYQQSSVQIQPYNNQAPYMQPKPAVVPINSNLNANTNYNNNALGNSNTYSAPQIANINEPVPAGYYRAMPGDTLYKIARTYNLQPRDLLAWNNLENPNQLNLYQLVRITPTYTSNNSAVRNTNTPQSYSNTNPITPISATSSNTNANTNNSNSVAAIPSLAWPIKNGRVVKKFDQKGIEIAGREGDVVLASEDGKVLFANTMRGYGKLVVISHASDIVTAYANLGHIAVRDQQVVKQGQTIGLISAAAASNEAPKLQFQVRKSSKAVDPLLYLPR